MWWTAWLVFGALLLLGYGALLLWLRGGLNRLAPPDSDGAVDVSVIVPAHDEQDNLPDLLAALDAQNGHAGRLEIILVDDRSTDATAQIMDVYASTRPHVKVLHIARTPAGVSPKKWAIAQAIAQASGDVILTTDADGRPGPRWVAAISAYFDADTDVVLGYAPYRTDAPFNRFFHKLAALEYFSLAAVAAGAVGRHFPLTSNGVNFAYRKALFLRVDGFGETLTELSGDDDLLLHRFITRGQAKVAFAAQAEAAVPNTPPEHLRRFIRQRLRFSSKHLAYPPRVMPVLAGIYAVHAWLLATLILAFFLPSGWTVATAALFFKAGADLCFLAKASNRLDSRPLLRYYLPALLPHLAYVVLIPLFAQLLPKRW